MKTPLVIGALLVVVALGASAEVNASQTRETFPGHNGKIAFGSWGVGRSGGRTMQIHLVNPDGTCRRALTSLGGRSPAWSPRGKRVAFSRATESASNFDLYVMNANGREVRRLTSGPESDDDPTWSPGGQIAFVRSFGNGTDLYVVNSAGGAAMPITDDHSFGRYPAWSPDGTRIAYTSLPNSDTGTDIWVRNADGTNPRRITSDPSSEYWPAWSPNARRIVFASNRRTQWDLYVMNADGGGVRRLTSTAMDESDPVWSPDGRRIAFVRARGGRSEIYVMHADGTHAKRITGNARSEFQPDWQRVPR